MLKKMVCLIVLSIILLSGCGTGNNVKSQNATETTNPYPALSAQEESTNLNTYPIAEPTQEQIYNAYPNPESVNSLVEQYPQYFVDKLVVPKPSEGKSIITGQLLIDGDASRPYITIIYLSVVTSNTDPNSPPVVNFKMDTDPIATQEISTGKFVFAGVNPGQYALVTWSASNSSVIEINPGNKLIFEANANEITDLGTIPVSP